jgi:hypothetical protein
MIVAEATGSFFAFNTWIFTVISCEKPEAEKRSRNNPKQYFNNIMRNKYLNKRIPGKILYEASLNKDQSVNGKIKF